MAEGESRGERVDWLKRGERGV
ncbi:hypothetical protein CCACVL1_07238 [Corchorus capsularis]|uniref:Uncharacterized protein n=1 Tax=Corchorus capsularis TaxID=210143 RepID=A0A1R3J827_COCAP|nr:hypothetical protein CCACVL1_07238 [Corchorus capsularis]